MTAVVPQDYRADAPYGKGCHPTPIRRKFSIYIKSENRICVHILLNDTA